MGFLKLDETILKSSIWENRDDRDIFLTALLMARPRTLKEPLEQLNVLNLEPTGFVVAPGEYGFIEAAGSGIVRASLVENEKGLESLARLGEPDPHSRSQEWEGRRLIRVQGGYVALNYIHYRDKDHTVVQRMRKYRARKKSREQEYREGALAAQDLIRGGE